MSAVTRRQFIHGAILGSAGYWLGCQTTARRLSPNEKLNIGVVGVANRGGANLSGVAGENIVALCDVDDIFLRAAAEKFPQAKTYNDFRRMLDRKDLDAVVCSTADHTHAVVSVAALRSGRHVYCEKPLTRTVSECRIVREAARKGRLVTQMGTQIHAGANYRRTVELIQSGAIGPVAEVHVWVNVRRGGMDRPSDTPPVPPNLHWELWLGPAAERPYHPAYLPGEWRNWWAFGTGGLGDFGCHYMDLPHWALGLRYCSSVEVVDGPPVHPESVPLWLILRYEYPARGNQPPVKLTWYHGGKQPEILPSILPEETDKKGNKKKADWPSGILFIGTKGMILANYGRHVLLPQKNFAGFEPPKPFIADSIGHHKEWIEACKTGGTTTCNFDYSGALAETVLLGNVAYRTGKKLEWDAATLRAKNCPEAQQFVQHQYRKGWKI
jgi:predicted dehydrogenase